MKEKVSHLPPSHVKNLYLQYTDTPTIDIANREVKGFGDAVTLISVVWGLRIDGIKVILHPIRAAL
jgi:hypothetical protein